MDWAPKESTLDMTIWTVAGSSTANPSAVTRPGAIPGQPIRRASWAASSWAVGWGSCHPWRAPPSWAPSLQTPAELVKSRRAASCRLYRATLLGRRRCEEVRPSEEAAALDPGRRPGHPRRAARGGADAALAQTGCPGASPSPAPSAEPLLMPEDNRLALFDKVWGAIDAGYLDPDLQRQGLGRHRRPVRAAVPPAGGRVARSTTWPRRWSTSWATTMSHFVSPLVIENLPPAEADYVGVGALVDTPPRRRPARARASCTCSRAAARRRPASSRATGS